MSTPTLLIVGAGSLHVFTIHAAHALGLRVLCTDANPHAPGCALADAYKPLDVYDIEGHRVLAREYKNILAGATCAGGDAAPTVAAVCEEAALPGIPYETACKTWNKASVRHALMVAGLQKYQPCWQRARNDDTPSWIGHKAWARHVGYPLVVKPLSQRASRGVSLVATPDILIPAVRKAYDATPRDDTFATKQILFEERLIGSEHSAEVVFDRHGACCHFHVCDRFFSYEDGIPIEIGHINPTRLAPDQCTSIKTMILESADALGVTVGSWKCDVIMTTGGPKILECTARCSGGYDAQVSYPRSSGDNLLRRVIQVACGAEPLPQPPIRQEHYCAVASIIPRKAGVVRALPDRGVEVIWAIRVGDVVQPPEHCAQRAGFVVRQGSNYRDTWTEAVWFADRYAAMLAERSG